MELQLNGIKVSIGDAELARLVEKQLKGSVAPPHQSPASSLPNIGEQWEGGIYAGLTIHDNQPMALVLLPGDESLNWKDAIAWAEKQDGSLPSRIDQLVLWKNVKDQFKGDWYWSSEQFAPDSVYAWAQVFSDGGQNDCREGGIFRARAVRRLTIQ
jgi:hypothetical protein